MDYGEWTENSRGTYNKGDGVARSTVQVSIVLKYEWYFIRSEASVLCTAWICPYYGSIFLFYKFK